MLISETKFSPLSREGDNSSPTVHGERWGLQRHLGRGELSQRYSFVSGVKKRLRLV
jgi:hypothetical protein